MSKKNKKKRIPRYKSWKRLQKTPFTKINRDGKIVEEKTIIFTKSSEDVFVETDDKKRFGEFCDSCGRRTDTKKVRRGFLCQDCREIEEKSYEK